MDADELGWNRTLREQWLVYLDYAFPEAPMADLVVHVHRESIHHLSEVCLLRDLYLHTRPATSGVTR